MSQSGQRGAATGRQEPAQLEGSSIAAPQNSRLSMLGERSAQTARVLDRLMRITVRLLPLAYLDGEFAFTMLATKGPKGEWRTARASSSLRYTAITALGIQHLDEETQRLILHGETVHDLVGRLIKRLDTVNNVGDAALVCWVAGDIGHSDLPLTIERLRTLDHSDSTDVVAAAWVVSALVAVRNEIDVEPYLAAARSRLLDARRSALYPHVTNGNAHWYRAHIGSFADQVYPVQALARLHLSSDDPQALSVAQAVTDAICAAQGDAGQWWWHYDSRTGRVVEQYPVYSVHQHSMAPMALMDLGDAGGEAHFDAISMGLEWLEKRPEIDEDLLLEEPPITWRKVARSDPHKLVRASRAMATRINSNMHLRALDRIYPPTAIDRECRPYELGWLLQTWLSVLPRIP